MSTVVSMKVPKMVRWAEIRAIIGDARTEEIITAKYGPKLLGPAKISVSPKAMENMLAHLEGRLVEGLNPRAYQQAIPAVFRLYFRESPKAKSRLVLWLKRQLETPIVTEAETPVEETATQMVADVKTKAKKGKRTVKPHVRMRNGKAVHVGASA